LKKRPTIPDNFKEDNISKYLIIIMKECWNDQISKRPTINHIFISMKSKHEQIDDLKNFDPYFLWNSNIIPSSNDEKIWSLEEGIDNKIILNNYEENFDENGSYYNLVELNDLDPLINND
jgi:hypothetical protein